MIQKLKEINHLATAFWRNEEGATAIEYALIASAVGLALAATLPLIQSSIDTTYDSILGYFSSI